MLPIFIAVADRPVILLGSGPMADAKARLLTRAGARIMRDENADAQLAIIAFEERLETEDTVKRLRARGVLINAVDRADLSDFILPAIVDRSPVLIAVGTGGASAGLSKMLRQALERLLPQSLGKLALALRHARPSIVRAFPSATARRNFIDQSLMPGGPLDPLIDHENAEGHLEKLIAGTTAITQNIVDTVWLTSDDPEDLTLKTARLLSMADVVVHDAKISAAIINRARADATRVQADQLGDAPLEGRVVFLKLEGP